MRYILPLLFAIFAASASAQTPSLYDTWSPELAGSVAHITVSEHLIIAKLPQEGFITQLPEFMALPSPKSSSDLPVEVVSRNNIPERTDTLALLKVVFDSAKAKGRLFVQTSKNDKSIMPLAFLIRDNGEAEIGIAGNLSMLFSKDMKSLKQVERATRPGIRHRSGKEKTIFDPMLDCFSGIHFTFYNQTKTAEFATLKDPALMPKEELLGMINSFGNRMSAALQSVPVDTSDSFSSMFNFVGPVYGSVLSITHDLFLAHGYNPLGAFALVEKVKDDSDVKAAVKIMGDKIEESVPFLRVAKFNREVEKEESLKMQLGQINSVCQQRIGLIANLLEDLNGEQGIDQLAIDRVSRTRIKAAGLILTPDVMKDSSTFGNYQKAQDDLTAALATLMESIEKNTDQKFQDDLSTILSQIEGQESRIRLESLKWNDLNASHQSDAHYQNFKPASGEAQQVQFSH